MGHRLSRGPQVTTVPPSQASTPTARASYRGPAHGPRPAWMASRSTGAAARSRPTSAAVCWLSMCTSSRPVGRSNSMGS